MAGILCWTGCQTRPAPAPGETDDDTRPDHEAWNVTIYLVQDSLQQAVVTAAHRLRYVSTGITILDQGLQAEFFDEQGHRSTVLKAKEGVIDEASHAMTVRGDVVIASEAHGTLETDSLRWIEAQDRIVTEAPVRITTARDTITGEGFEGDTALRRWRILRNVQGRFDRAEELSETLDEEQRP
jgi:LPS export ABC transporter protein LptC